MSIPRRAFSLSVALCLAALAAGCGFHPAFAPAGSAQEAQLRAIYVDIIPNRPGQLLRQALQQRLEGSDDAVARRYVLAVNYSEGAVGLGVQADNSTTRNRDIGTAVWSLRRDGPGGTQIASGHVRSVDGYNIIDEQFFYADLAEDAAQHRLAEALADQITLEIGLFFRKHPELA